MVGFLGVAPGVGAFLVGDVWGVIVPGATGYGGVVVFVLGSYDGVVSGDSCVLSDVGVSLDGGISFE